MDGEVTEAVDKGKGRADEVSNDEVSSSQAAGGEEVRVSGRGHGGAGHGQSRGHSQSCRPRKRVKSTLIIDSDKEEKPTHPASNKTFDLQHPPPDFPILPAMDRCNYCAHRETTLRAKPKELPHGTLRRNRTRDLRAKTQRELEWRASGCWIAAVYILHYMCPVRGYP